MSTSNVLPMVVTCPGCGREFRYVCVCGMTRSAAARLRDELARNSALRWARTYLHPGGAA